MAVACVLGTLEAHAIAPGDIIVLEQGTASEASSVSAALVAIDPLSGSQSIISSSGLLSNQIGENPVGFVRDPYTGMFFVVDRKGSVIRIDPLNGAQAVVKDGLDSPRAIAVEHSGATALVAQLGGSLLRMELSSGATSVVANGGLIGEIAPWAVQVAIDGSIFLSGLTAGGGDVLGPPSRVIRIDPLSGAQFLVAESTDSQFRDFALTSTHALIAVSSRGDPAGLDRVMSLDLSNGELIPLLTGLQRVLDVDIGSNDEILVLDQLLSLPCCPPWLPVVYRSTQSGASPSEVSQGGEMFAPARLTIVPNDLQALQECRVDLAGALRDSDYDGILDRFDICPNTTAGIGIDDAGCSLSQFCRAIDVQDSRGSRICRRADWANDEPIMTSASRDCTVSRNGPGRTDDECAPVTQ